MHRLPPTWAFRSVVTASEQVLRVLLAWSNKTSSW